MALKPGAVIAGVALTIVGCQTLASGEDVAARITNPTDHSRAALHNAVNDALNTDATKYAEPAGTGSQHGYAHPVHAALSYNQTEIGGPHASL